MTNRMLDNTRRADNGLVPAIPGEIDAHDALEGS